jgi:hypothetical protein
VILNFSSLFCTGNTRAAGNGGNHENRCMFE